MPYLSTVWHYVLPVWRKVVEKSISREIFDTTNYEVICNLLQEKGKDWGFAAGI
jgi:hypothetical protein